MSNNAPISERIPMIVKRISYPAYCANAHQIAAAIAVPIPIAVEYILRWKLSWFLSNEVDRMPNRVG